MKSFWVQIANQLHRQRPVHHRPFDELAILELRGAILRCLKMLSKWSGKPGTDPQPVKWMELDTSSDALLDGETRVVSWVWFLEDGMHVICVVEDTIVQVWNLVSQQRVASFYAGGTLQRACKYVDSKKLLVAGSVSIVDADFNSKDVFKVWEYQWDNSSDVRAMVEMTIPVEATFTFITGEFAGLVYTDSPEFVDRPSWQPGYSDDLNILVLDLQRPSIVLNCFTPLSIFDQSHTQNLRKNLFRMVRSPDHIHLHFGETLDFLLYTYSLETITTLLTQQTRPHNHDDPRILLPPTCKTSFQLSDDQSQELPNGLWTSLGDSCLWDGRRVGFLSGIYRTVGEERQHVLTLSALSIEKVGTPPLQDKLSMTERTVPYSRSLVYVRPQEYDAGHTPDGYWLMSQPNWAKSAIWTLAPSGNRLQVEYLVVGRFPDVPLDGAMEKAASVDESEDKEVSASPFSRGDSVVINITKWIEAGQRVYDLDLDDCQGRVGLGLANGRALILEFV
ncbi:hypothetical protein FS842_004991 [Serendipita sp. 407]|nr:hypothetical protein FS842_004991 [Serendipita sp. 407]